MKQNPDPSAAHSIPVPPVTRIGITGGIGSGKSFVCRRIAAAGHRVFYCDDEAKRIIRTHPAVMDELRALVGPEVYDSEGRLVKSVLAAYLCRGRDYSRRVDAIVHPRVAEAFNRLCASLTPPPGVCAALPAPVGTAPQPLTVGQLCALPVGTAVFMECALLFEAGFDRLVDAAVLVHVSPETQIRRLMARDEISREKAQEWMALQLTEDERLHRADYVIDNEKVLPVSK